MWADALVIAGVVALNAAIGYVTESQTEQTIHALKSLGRPSTQVLRDGDLCTVRGEEVVPGDVLLLRPGSYVAADARVLAAERLSLDAVFDGLAEGLGVDSLTRHEVSTIRLQTHFLESHVPVQSD